MGTTSSSGQPAATRSGDYNDKVLDEPEYMQAVMRVLRRDPRIDTAEGAGHATPLQGTDVSTLFMFCWQGWVKGGRDHRGPAQRVANEIMRIFREHKKALERGEVTPGLASLTADRRVRQETRNWRPRPWNDNGSSEHFNKFSDVEMYFKQHEGEARVWRTGPEQWLPLVKRQPAATEHGQPAATEGLAYYGLEENVMGNKYYGTTIGVTHADRAQEFY